MDDTGLPDLTAEGLLPAGVHDCSLEAIGRAFGRFQRSDRRPKLFEKLCRYVEEVRGVGWTSGIVINGSFVMGCVDEPEDIDLILALPQTWDMAAEVRPREYNLISKTRTRQAYGFDVFAVPAGSAAEYNWIEFFQRINTKWLNAFGWSATLKKGIVRIRS
jgi:hypothetical protein